MKNIFKKYHCVLQHDYKDCGCACLATICKQYGLTYPISKIREISGTDKSGTSALGLIKCAKKLNFSTKAIKITNNDDLFRDIPLPAIAHVVIGDGVLHYVVIHEITKKEITIADPASGIVKFEPNEFFKIWTGVLFIMVPTTKFKSGNKKQSVISTFMQLIKPQKALLTNIFLSSIVITLFGILGSFYYQLLIDNIVPNNLRDTLHTVSIGFIILMFFKIVTEAFRTQLLLHLEPKLDIPLMLGYYEHVINLPMNFFETREVGEIVSRFNDASSIRSAISSITLTMMMDSFMVIFGGAMLYYRSPLLFKITLIPLLLYALIVYGFKNSIEKINRETMESNSKFTSYLVESLNGIETIKSFTAESEVNSKSEKKFVTVLQNIFKNGCINNLQLSLKAFVKGTFSICILWIGVVQVLNGRISLGELLTFNSLLAYFLSPIENIIGLQPTIQTALVAAERLFEILDLSIEKSDNEDHKLKPSSLKGPIEFKNLDFRYNSRNLVLKNINLKINQGEKIALVGGSGSGKTTLAKLLMNFYQCENGEITLNGSNILDINTETLRDKVAYISQNTFLFTGTIIENLTLGNPDITYDEIIDVCKKVKIHDFINELPLRYNTLVEENGSNFSGGQKQRLSIARSLLKKPEILIMDEATSNLDSITESAIEKTIYDLSSDVTTIIIAHRLSTIMRCDKIYVLNNGEIIEEGSNNELINKKGVYYNLWKEQLNKNSNPLILEEVEVYES